MFSDPHPHSQYDYAALSPASPPTPTAARGAPSPTTSSPTTSSPTAPDPTTTTPSPPVRHSRSSGRLSNIAERSHDALGAYDPHRDAAPAAARADYYYSTAAAMDDHHSDTPSRIGGAGTPQPDLTRNRLPTLFEVLSRRTLPPVDLFSFYIYMRDQQRSVDYLDFWLDVAQHMSLCRHYVRELRRSVLVGTPDLEKSVSKRSSAILDSMGDMSHHSDAGPSGYGSEKERDQDAQMSAYLREELANDGGAGPSNSAYPTTPPSNRNTPPFGGTPARHPTHDSNSPAHAVLRQDIRASAEKILYTFLMPGAEREITLPGSITQDVTSAIEEFGRDDPEVFDVAKDYVFQAMERDAFPGFLRMRALGNLIPPTRFIRLIVGLVAMFGAFWTAFVLIFLDASRLRRCWVILPFTVGVYFLASHQYSLDPIMALLGFSEYTPFNWSRIREPYVRKLLVKRALMVLVVTALIDAALCALFIFVPGKRL